MATIGVKVSNAYAEIADENEESLVEQLKEVMPVLIAFATYAAKIIVQFRCAVHVHIFCALPVN